MRRRLEAAAWGIPVGVLGGLIGLGGGEFRIPVLLRRFALSPGVLVPLNSVISLITLAASFLFRAGSLSLSPLAPHVADLAAIAGGGLVAAVVGAGLVARLSDRNLHRAILVLLVALGLLLVVEGVVGTEVRLDVLPTDGFRRALTGVGLGAAIGLIATLLGVAGGELLIPTLVFVHGLEVKPAGSGSLAVSLLVVSAALLRYRLAGRLPAREDVRDIGVPMGAGSIAGAAAGAALAAFAPSSALKVVLGLVLLAAAWVSARR
ncbi:MAG: TSUP family transporter [Elioraea sp.]|nr:TSUP family transporter [Elioraea sp.]